MTADGTEAFVTNFTAHHAPPIIVRYAVTKSWRVGPFWRRTWLHTIESEFSTLTDVDDDGVKFMASLPCNVLVIDVGQANRLGL